MRSWAFVIAVCLTGASSTAQVSVWTTLDPPEVPFHRVATLTLHVDAPAELDIELPDLRPMLGDAPVKGSPDFQSAPSTENRVLRRERYVLDPIHVKDYVIGAIPVTWEGGEVVLPQQLFRVRELTEEERAAAESFDGSLTAATEFIHPSLWTRWELWAAILVALTAAVVIVLTYLRNRKDVYLAASPKTAWELAFDRLDALEARGYSKAGMSEPFYVDLSAILRYYIEGRFDLHAPERTTPEFLDEVTGRGVFTPEQEQFLASFLRQGDRVKFARYEPDSREMELHFSDVRRFVEETVPQTAETGEAKAA